MTFTKAESNEHNNTMQADAINEQGNLFADLFDQLSTAQNARMTERGFWEEHNEIQEILSNLPADEYPNHLELAKYHHTEMMGQKLALMHSELGEALEGVRDGDTPSKKIPAFSQVEEELADIVIRIMDLSGRQGYRLGRAIIEKMAYNASRPYKHGRTC